MLLFSQFWENLSHLKAEHLKRTVLTHICLSFLLVKRDVCARISDLLVHVSRMHVIFCLINILVSHSFIRLKSCELTVQLDFLSPRFSASARRDCKSPELRALGTQNILNQNLTTLFERFDITCDLSFAFEGKRLKNPPFESFEFRNACKYFALQQPNYFANHRREVLDNRNAHHQFLVM